MIHVFDGNRTMKYSCVRDECEYYYEVTYDRARLANIFKKLKEFKYTKYYNGQLAGDITRFPATINNLYNRIVARTDRKVYKNSIVHHTENNMDYVTYVYSKEKHVDLYGYIDSVINPINAHLYSELFSSLSLLRFDGIDQEILDGLLNYSKSSELEDINIPNIDVCSFCSKQDIDYEELKELYKETLSCFEFKLVAKKEKVSDSEKVDGYSYSLRLKK